MMKLVNMLHFSISKGKGAWTLSSWMDTIRGSEICLLCGESFEGEVRWSWMLGLGDDNLLCGKCARGLMPIKEVSCIECGRPRIKEDEQNIGTKLESELCDDCKRWREISPWDCHSFQHRALYVYNPFMQELIAQFKYRGDTELATLFHKKLFKLAKKLGKFDVVIPIPLNVKRQWERGFNQAEVLAQDFYTKKLLIRNDTTHEKQSKRSREERIASLKSAFIFKGDVKELVDKSVLLIDDVYTTGATLRSAAQTLYNHGAKNVFAVTVARSVGTIIRSQLKN